MNEAFEFIPEDFAAALKASNIVIPNFEQHAHEMILSGMNEDIVIANIAKRIGDALSTWPNSDGKTEHQMVLVMLGVAIYHYTKIKYGMGLN